jgi:hypothetical protein
MCSIIVYAQLLRKRRRERNNRLARREYHRNILVKWEPMTG